MPGIRQTSFAGGERAPDLWNATEVAGYGVSVRRMRNFFPIPHGAAVNRPGSRLVADRVGKDHSQAAWLLPFIFSEAAGQAYAIELGHQYARFITNVNGAYVAPDAAQYPAWDVAATYAAGAWVSSGGVAYRSLQAANTGNDPAASPAWWDSPAVYEIPTPYAHADLAGVQFAQVGDVVTLVRHGYVEAELRRYAHARWTLSDLSFDIPASRLMAALDASPMRPSARGGAIAAAAKPWKYFLTTLERDPATGFVTESAPFEVKFYNPGMGVYTAIPELNTFGGYFFQEGDPAGLVVPIPYTTEVIGVRLYVGQGKEIGFAGEGEVSFDGPPATGIIGFKVWANGTIDYTRGPPRGRNPLKIFDGKGTLVRTDQAACVAFFERRRVFGNLGSAATPYRPRTVVASAIENFVNFDEHTLPAAEDAVELSLSSRLSGEVRWLLDAHRLLIGTSAGIFAAAGKQGAPLAADEVPDVKLQNEEGAAAIHPIRVLDDVLYVGDRADSVMALIWDDVRQKFLGQPLEELSDHLVRQYRVVDWAYQRKPWSIVWAVRDDGTLLSLTYRPSMKTVGWAWHELAGGGKAESICAIPQGAEDAVYLVVRRTIGGVTKRYVERLTSRQVNDARLGVFVDSSLTFDGRNATATTVTVSEVAGGGYAPEASVAIASSADVFVPGDVGNDVVLDPDALPREDADGNALPVLGPVRLRITAYTGPRDVTAEVISPAVPAELQAAAAAWARAVDELSGLDHLEGEEVVALADGSVVTTDAGGAPLVVAGGAVTLPEPAAIVHVGLAYEGELEFLDLAAGGDARGKEKVVKRVLVDVTKTRGLQAGRSLTALRPWNVQAKDITEIGDGPVKLLTGLAEIPVDGEWAKHGRCAVRQADPYPCTVVAVTREVDVRG
jgi:hypothetical protein